MNNFSPYVDNATPQSQPQWADASGVDDCGVNSDMLNNQQLTIDEGTISVSSQYSQEYVSKYSLFSIMCHHLSIMIPVS
jgi:hypothetical protein